MFCKHQWEEVERKFTAPTNAKGVEISGLPGDVQDILDGMLYGVTTIVLKCNKCGKMKSVRCVGDLVNK